MAPLMTAGGRGLYLCYFGLREPLVQTQVLPYVRELARAGMRMSLLTFEPEPVRLWNATELREWEERLASEGIAWHVLPYHRRPSLPAKIYDVARGTIRAVRLVRRDRIDVLHARSHLAAAIGAITRRLTGAKLIFDFRGSLAEEYVASGHWSSNGLLYRLTIAAERWLFRSADGFVMLTERARRRYLHDERSRPVEVIPCCVDISRFTRVDRDDLRRRLGFAGRTVVVYLGTLGGLYLTRQIAELFAVAHELDPQAFLLVISKSDPRDLFVALRQLGIGEEHHRVVVSSPENVPQYLQAADVGVSLIRASAASAAQSPVKFAEYLAAGLPVISTAGVGDSEAEIVEERLGVILRGLDRDAFVDAWRGIEILRRDPELSMRCREHARTRYALQSVGGERYGRLYRRLLEAR